MSFIISIGALFASALIFSKKYAFVAVMFLVVFFFTVDYYNYLSRHVFGTESVLSKSYREILFFSVASLFLLNKGKSNVRLVLLLSVFSFFFIVYGSLVNSAFEAILDWRDSILPIITAVLLVSSNVVNKGNIGKIISFTCILVVFNSLYAIYQYVSFDSIVEDIWRYNLLADARENNVTENELRFVTYQLMRDDKLRASGMFVSALQFSYIAAFSAFYYLLNAFSLIDKRYVGFGIIMNLFLFSICMLGVIVSQVRASFIIFSISVLAFLMLKFFESYRMRKLNMLLCFSIILSFYIFVILLLSYFGSGILDDSALGRLPQYIFALENFEILGNGLGRFRAQFDSYYVYISLTFGLGALYIISLFVIVVCKLSDLVSYDITSRNYVLFALSSFVGFFCVLILQHTSGSLYYQIILLLAFCMTKGHGKNVAQP